MGDYNEVGSMFVEQYYKVFDTDRAGTIGLYHPSALLTYNTFLAQGHEQILEVFQKKVQFKQIAHMVSSKQCQPWADGSILIMVTGKLRPDQDMPLDFCESFVLRKNDTGNWCISNHIFNLVLHDV